MLKDSNDNLIRLTAREHFLAHYHLWKAYRDELNEKAWAKKMLFAFRRMKQELRMCDDLTELSKLYEESRIAMSEGQRGEKNH